MRLALKTLSYGATHIVVATMVAYFLTGNLMAAIGIGILEPLVQTGVFTLHEMLWEGKREPSTKSHNHGLCGSIA